MCTHSVTNNAKGGSWALCRVPNLMPTNANGSPVMVQNGHAFRIDGKWLNKNTFSLFLAGVEALVWFSWKTVLTKVELCSWSPKTIPFILVTSRSRCVLLHFPWPSYQLASRTEWDILKSPVLHQGDCGCSQHSHFSMNKIQIKRASERMTKNCNFSATSFNRGTFSF